jgi:predicted DsbA family dithiol-disulfide isomerase
MTASPTPLRLDVVSDVVCPWCWLGKARLDAAIAKVGADLQVAVTYRPFQLDPSTPREGLPMQEYMRARFGAALDRIKQGQAHLKAEGAKMGLDYRFDDIPRQPNTLDAHRLIRWAGTVGKGSEATEALFKAHFHDGKNVGDRDVLADLAASLGLDREATRARLATDEDLMQIQGEEAYLRQLGVAAVPTYIANGRTAVQGAQPVEAFERFLRTAAAQPDVRRA